MIRHDDLSLFSDCTQNPVQHTGEFAAVTGSLPAVQTHQTRQPMRVVGNIMSELSNLYSMAGTFISRINLPRVGARVFGQLALAGL